VNWRIRYTFVYQQENDNIDLKSDANMNIAKQIAKYEGNGFTREPAETPLVE
jgi:hypothetical protein